MFTFYFMYVGVLPVYMYVYHMHVVPKEVTTGLDPLELELCWN